MTWLYLVISGHLINAVSFVLIKFLLDKHIKNSNVLAIVVGVLGVGVFLLFPFGLVWPSVSQMFFNILAGAILILAILLFNYTLKKHEVSRAVPIVGGAIPIFTWLLSFIFLREVLLPFEILAFVLLFLGTVILAVETKAKGRLSGNLIFLSLASAMSFALAFVLSKVCFEVQPFVSAFIWIRLGSFLVVVFLLFNLENRQDTKRLLLKTPNKIKIIFILTLVLGAVGFSLINYAIAIGSVTMVNALQGVQYAFLLILVLILSKFAPKIILEKYSRKVLLQKIIGIILISAGIVVLSSL